MDAKLNRALWVSGIGVHVFWIAAVTSTWIGMRYEGYEDTSSGFLGFKHWSLYALLLGLGIASFLVTLAHAAADRVAHENVDSLSARGVFRVISVLVILALVFGAVLAFAILISGFSQNYSSLGDRLLSVELPIALDTALVVWVLLRATVLRRGEKLANTDSRKMSPERKALVWGYVLPILGTAVAIVMGIEVYNLQGRSLDVWSWTVIQAIIGLSIVFGTRFAVRARAGVVAPVRERKVVAGAVGAVNLNLVLSIVFVAVVGIMSFSFAEGALNDLRSYSNTSGIPTWEAPSLSWWISKMVPSYLLLVFATTGLYLSVRLRLGIKPRG